MNHELIAAFGQTDRYAELRSDQDLDREPRAHPVLVLRRDQEAGDDQLPHLQAGAGRPVLRPHLRADQGLRVPVRQVQADEVSRNHLRKVRRRGDPFQGAPRPHGAYRARLAGRPYLVPEVAAEPHRPASRHDAEGPRAHPLFRELRRHRAGPDASEAASAAERGPVHGGPGRARGRFLPSRHRRRSAPDHALRHQP